MLVGANEHFCHRRHLYHLSGEAKECQHPLLVSVAGMARDSKGRFCKEEAQRPFPCPSSSVLSATPAKRVRFHGDEEEPSQRAAPCVFLGAP
jgi:hypothetical protein